MEKVEKLFGEFSKKMPAEAAANLTLAVILQNFTEIFKEASEKQKNILEALKSKNGFQ